MVLLYFETWKLLTLGVVFVTFLWVRAVRAPRITRDGKPLRNPPNTLPLLGNGLHFLLPRQTLFSWFTTIINSPAYHPLETLSISVPTLPPGVIISSPENLDYVFKNEALFKKGEFFRGRSWDLFGEGIINVDGEGWRVQRRAGVGFLSGKRLENLMEGVLPGYLQEAVRYLDGKAGGQKDGDDDSRSSEARSAPGRAAGGITEGDGQVVDLQEVIHELTTQVMGKVAYNMEMHVNDEFTKAFEFASGGTAERFQNPGWRVTEWFTWKGWELGRCLGVVRGYGRGIVRRAVERKMKREGSGGGGEEKEEEEGTLIDSLLDVIGDEKLVADAALNYLSAGRDTVAQALTWTFYLLLDHPEVVSTLRQHLERLRKELGAETLEEILTPEYITPGNVPYAMAIFYEGLRLFPPIPFEIKQVVEGTRLPDGTELPAGAVVTWCPWAMGRCRHIWGEDVEEFKPERWLERVDGEDENESRELSGSEKGKMKVKVRTQGEFPVFNGGSRLCLGKKMAEGVGVAVLGGLAGRFDFGKGFEGERRSVVSSLTLPMEGGWSFLGWGGGGICRDGEGMVWCVIKTGQVM